MIFVKSLKEEVYQSNLKENQITHNIVFEKQFLRILQSKHSMNSLKQNQYQLKEILKNCKQEQEKIEELKKQLNSTIFSKPKVKYFQKIKQKSSSLLKNSRIHIQAFQRKYDKFNVNQIAFAAINKTLNNSPTSKKKQQASSKFQKFNQIQKKLSDQTNDKEQQQQQSKHYRQKQKYILPRINSVYCQTYSPKNASFSYHAMGQKQLKNSVHRKLFEKQKKYLNKQNLMLQYEQNKTMNEQKIDLYRLHILKEIYQQNVKKALLKKNLNKKKRNMPQSRQYNISRSYILQN